MDGWMDGWIFFEFPMCYISKNIEHFKKSKTFYDKRKSPLLAICVLCLVPILHHEASLMTD